MAVEKFTSEGYGATTLDEIGQALGLVKASLYYYFPSKEELFYAILADYVYRLHEAVEAGIAEEVDPVSRLHLLVATHIEYAASDRVSLLRAEARLFVGDGRTRHADATHAESLRQRMKVYRRYVNSAVADAFGGRVDTELATELLLAAMNNVIVEGGRRRARKVALHHADILVGGLAAPFSHR